METYLDKISQDCYDGAFYRAVLALHNEQFPVAQQVSEFEKRIFTVQQVFCKVLIYKVII